MGRTILIVSLLLIFSALVFAKDVEVLTQNSYFEDDLEFWEVMLSGGAVTTAEIDDSDSVKGSQCIYIDIEQLGDSKGFWEIKLGQTVLEVIEAGETYTLSVWAKGDGGPRQIRPHLRIGIGGKSPWQAQHAQTFDITEEWAEYSHTFAAGGEPDGLVDIALGTMLGNFWMDNIRLYKGVYEEDPDLGRTKKLLVMAQDKLATTWGSIKEQ
ncbi:carbohydrate binding domain-containing protein [Candidatus Poribacteria bacterium]